MEKHSNVILIGIAIILFGVSSAVFVMSSSKDATVVDTLPVGATHSITLTEIGYEPKELTIDVGDVVEFSTVRAYPHWPASNIHPTHNQYPAFDPQHSVPANQTWSFQFLQAGEWQFHDHLNSTYTGTITVREP